MPWLGIALSATHAIADGIMGVGATKRLSAVRRGCGKRIIYSWIITILSSAAVAALVSIIIIKLYRFYSIATEDFQMQFRYNMMRLLVT